VASVPTLTDRDIHIYRLRTKLGPDWGRRIETIHGIGYCLSSMTALGPDPM
jgi:DNA-binding response OmpR family regulator